MTPSADTYARLRQTINWHPVAPEMADEIMRAWTATARHDVAWDDLPADVRELVEAVEAEPVDMPPAVHLWQRLSDTLGSHDLDPGDRDRIVAAYEATQSWDDLPDDIKTLVETVEQLPRTDWDDPADAPDDTSYLDDAEPAAQPTRA